jgi:hypothetical protein
MTEENLKEEEKKVSTKKDSEEEMHPAEEQGITEDQTSEEKKEDMEEGELDEDVYSDEGREKLVEDGEMEPDEAGFMQGASDAGQLGKDALTGEPLMGIEDVVEAKIEGKLYRFVNEENAQKFREKKQSESE